MKSLTSMPCMFLVAVCFSTVALCQPAVPQQSIRLVEYMPDRPFPYKMKNWKYVARRQDSLFFDFSAKGPFLPLIRWDDNNTNFPIRSFRLPSYVGSTRFNDRQYESLPAIGSVLGATLAGIDKSRQNGNDFVTMCKQFFNRANGVNMVMNTPDRKPGSTFWYEIWPGMSFNMLADLYPDNSDLSALMKQNAENWLPVIEGLSKGRPYPDFNFTSYNFSAGKGFYNGRWREPDAAAGLAWLEFTAWKRFGDGKFLDAARKSMEFLQQRPAAEGVFYEIMMPYGAYLAVRMNAEMGTAFDELKMLNWCFDGDNTDRDGWGVMAERWGAYDVHGLVGQKKWEQYAFAMNTYSQAAALVPIVKYNPAYAASIGKWMLNLANASRLFYADEHPRNRQSSAVWEGDPAHVISYEGLRKDLDHNNHFHVFKGVLADEGPYAIGDQVKQGSSFTDICLYGSAWVGMLASIVDTTDQEMILRLDCNATDFFGSRRFPTYLYYNPFPETKQISYDAGDKPVKLYDLVTRKFLPQAYTGKVTIDIPAREARLLVTVPADSKPVMKKNKLYIGDQVIDFRAR